MVRSRGEACRWLGADVPFGVRRRRVRGGLAAERTRWVDAGRQGIVRAFAFGWSPVRFMSAPEPGLRSWLERGHPADPPRPINSGDHPPPSVVPSHADRSQRTDPPDRPSNHHGNRLVGRRAVGGGPPESSRRGIATSGWQVGAAWCVGRRTIQGSGSGR
jgi:hypothetical protein